MELKLWGKRSLRVQLRKTSPLLETREMFQDEGEVERKIFNDNLFGSIANNMAPVATSMGFIPINGQGGTLSLTGNDDSTRWLGLNTKQMQWWAYNFCSPLAGVIDRLAEADTNGIFSIVKDDDTPTQSPVATRLKKLFARPNPLQTWEEFNSQQVVICKIFGYCPVFCICPVGFDKTYTTTMWNLSPFFAQPQINYEFDMYASEGSPNSNPISLWRISIFGKTYSIDSSQIMLLKDGFVDNTVPNMGLPLSKISGLDYSVSNICAAMEADNVLLRKKGPLGIFSYDPGSGDQFGAKIAMSEPDKQELDKSLARYGLSWDKLQWVTTRTPVKWQPMSFDVQKLMTKETVRQGIEAICDRMGFPAELMSGKNATYENRDSAEKFLYQNNIIPFSLRRMSRMGNYFGLTGSGIKIKMEYNHLHVLQDDILKAGQAKYANSQGLQIDWQMGIITFNEYRVQIGQDPIADGDIYYQDYLKKYKIQPTVTPTA